MKRRDCAILIAALVSISSATSLGQSFNVVQLQGAVSPIVGSGATSYGGDGGVALFAGLSAPTSVAIDVQGDLYIADTGNHVIRKVDAETGIISTVAGTGVGGFSEEEGLATEVQLSEPEYVAVAENGDLYISDTGNGRLRKVSAETGLISTVYGTPELIPGDIAIDNLNGLVYFTDRITRSRREVNSVQRILPSGDVAPFLERRSLKDNIAVDLVGNLFARYGDYPSAIALFGKNSGAEDSIFVKVDGRISAFAVTSDSDVYYTKRLDYLLRWGVFRYGAIGLGSGFQEVGEEQIGGLPLRKYLRSNRRPIGQCHLC